MRVTLDEIKDHFKDLYGTDSDEWERSFCNECTESEHKYLYEFNDDDEFYTYYYDKYEPIDTADELLEYDKCVQYIEDNDLLKEFKEYSLEQDIDVCFKYGAKLCIYPETWEKMVFKYVAEDMDDYLEWLWSLKE